MHHRSLHSRLTPALIVATTMICAGACASAHSRAAATPTTVGGTISCAYSPTGQPAARSVGKPPTRASQLGTSTATLTTNQGAIVIKLDPAQAPCTVNSFVYLAEKKYFDATPCHRLTTAGIFVLQCGDPTGTGSGGPGYEFADENLNGAVYPAGTVAMANAGPGTNGSQFFLVYADTTLAPNYTPFATITGGLAVIQKIAAAGSDNSNGQGDGKPNLPVEITNVTVATS
ncbi:MAG TPA: peptidylprolyl isomerase [Acidothermaceae bacterium]